VERARCAVHRSDCESSTFDAAAAAAADSQLLLLVNRQTVKKHG
jgi:hypothetical protein